MPPRLFVMKDLDRVIGRYQRYQNITLLATGLASSSAILGVEHRSQIDAVDQNHPQTAQAAELMTHGVIYAHDDKVYVDVDLLGNPSIEQAATLENRRLKQIETEKAELKDMYIGKGTIGLDIPIEQTYNAGVVLGSLLTMFGLVKMGQTRESLKPRAKSHQVQTSS